MTEFWNQIMMEPLEPADAEHHPEGPSAWDWPCACGHELLRDHMRAGLLGSCRATPWCPCWEYGPAHCAVSVSFSRAVTSPETQHPDAAPLCGEPTGMMAIQHSHFLCQRGQGHPGMHEAMTRDGNRLEWGLASDLPDYDE